jgi:hypothetical protein
MRLKNLLASTLFLLLAACGGGGGNPGTCMASAATCSAISAPGPSNPSPSVPAASPTGLYRGTTSDGRNVAALVLDSGEFWVIYTAAGSTTLIAGAEQGHGTFSNGTFTANDLRDFSLERAAISDGTMTGTYVTASGIAGTATFSTLAVSFVAAYDISSSIPASLSTVAGAYSGTAATLSGIDNATFTVSSDGTLAGLSQLGCRFSGVVTPDPTVNAFAVSVTFQGGTCSNATGTVAGVGYFDSGTRRIYGAALNADRSNGFIFAGAKQ